MRRSIDPHRTIGISMNEMHGSRDFAPVHITALTILNKGLSQALAEYSDLTTTQYRVLLKAREMKNGGRLGEIAKSLMLRSNAVTAAVDGLEERKLLRRARTKEDRRITILELTETGENTISRMDREIMSQFAQAFGTDEDKLNPILQQFYLVGSSIEGSPTFEPQGHITSTAVTTVAATMDFLNKHIRRIAGISLTDFRVLQLACLAEGGARIVDIAGELVLPSNTITWTADRLQDEELCERGDVENDSRAVRIVPTQRGIEICDRIQTELNGFLDRLIWPHMDEEQIAATYTSAQELIDAALAIQAQENS